MRELMRWGFQVEAPTEQDVSPPPIDDEPKLIDRKKWLAPPPDPVRDRRMAEEAWSRYPHMVRIAHVRDDGSVALFRDTRGVGPLHVQGRKPAVPNPTPPGRAWMRLDTMLRKSREVVSVMYYDHLPLASDLGVVGADAPTDAVVSCQEWYIRTPLQGGGGRCEISWMWDLMRADGSRYLIPAAS